MNMSWFDWGIVAALVVFLTLMANYTRRYNRSVADFLVANRCAGRYMLAVAGNMSAMGAISILAWYEMFYKGGFSAAWWNMMMYSAPVIIGVTGWVIYRYRQTRAMTLSQFFELRYSKRFRIFSGILGFVSGTLNFGIFPAVGARFFIYFCGLPEKVLIASIPFPTFPLVMIILLSLSLYFTFAGGQITVMVTDFIQGIICNIFIIIIIIYIAMFFNWSQITEALLTAPKDASLVHPIHSKNVEDFNVWYFLIGVLAMFYNTGAWQGSQGYNSSAINPTEQKMGRALHYLRTLMQASVFALIAICAYTIMHHPDFAHLADNVNDVLSRIDNSTIRGQMVVPIATATFLKYGLLGSMCAVVLTAFISTHDTYLHSWGSIFIQDIVVPLRKKPFTRRQHMRLLKLSIFGVAIFIFFWSLLFQVNESIFMYFAITGAVYLGGVGAVIIGGLYWKKGTTTAAWWTMSVGSILAVTGIIIRQIWPDFFINSQWMFFITIVVSSLLYVSISLLCKRQEFDIDRMLHRGKYAANDKATAKNNCHDSLWQRLGFKKELKRGDKLTYAVCLGWTFLLIGTFTIGTIYNLFINKNVSDKTWATFWYIWLIVSIFGVVILTIWYSIGGLKNLKDMFRRLSTMERNDLDDGTVVDHRNLDEADLRQDTS